MKILRAIKKRKLICPGCKAMNSQDIEDNSSIICNKCMLADPMKELKSS